MKKYKSKLTFLLVLSQVLMFFSAKAFAAESFYGMTGSTYVGVDLISSRVQHRYTAARNIFGTPEAPKVENGSLGYGVNVGYKINKDKFFIAPEAFYEAINNSAADFYYSSATKGDKTKVESRYGIKLNVGYDVTNKFGIFANYGIASDAYNQHFGSVNRHYNSRKTGYVYGGGLSYRINGNLSVRLSYDIQQLKTNYDIAGDSSGGISSDQKDSIKIKATKIGLVYNF